MDSTARQSRTRSTGPGALSGAANVRDLLTPAILATVVFVGGIAPLATDMYVPAFPLVAVDPQASATQVQLLLGFHVVRRGGD